MFCIYNKGQMSLQFPAEISVGLVLTSQSHSLEEGHYKEAWKREMSHHRASQERRYTSNQFWHEVELLLCLVGMDFNR